MNKLGNYLKKLRIQHGFSLKKVYQATGITDSKLIRIENGANNSEVSPKDLKALAKLFKINLVDLYLIAGYLDEESLSSYEQVFQNADLLSDDERNNIQEQIDLFTKGRKKS